jgi:hypothetical protein
MKTFTSQVAQWWSRVGFEDAAQAERTLVVGTLAGVVTALGALLWPVSAPVSMAAVCAVCLVVLPGRFAWWQRVLAVLGTTVALMVVGARASHASYALALALGGSLALGPRAWWQRALALAAPVAAVAWALFVVRWLGARHLGLAGVLAVPAQLASGLFLAVAAVVPSLALAVDAVEPTLAADPKVRAAWVRLHRALARLRDSQARARLTRAAAEVAARWVAASAEQDELEAVDGTAAAEAQERIEALDAASEATHDEELLRHYQQSLRVHRDTLEQFDGLKRRAERARARCVAEATWLDTAAFTLETTPALSANEADAVDRLVALSRRVGAPVTPLPSQARPAEELLAG